MPRKAKHSKRRLSRGISNLIPHASSQGHSTSVGPPLQPSKLAQPCAPTSTITPIPISQNLVLPPDLQLHTMPHKAKRSNKRVRHATSNLMSHASSQGHSAPVELSLEPSKAAQPYAPTITIIPPLVPTDQNMVSASDPPSYTMPHKAKRSNKRVRHATSNLMSHASSQGHSAPVELSLEPSKAARPCAPTITIIPPLVPTDQNMVSVSDPPSYTMPCKAKYSNKRVRRGISNLVPHASSKGHSTPVEPPLNPSKAAQPRAPSITFIPPSIPTAQNLVSPSDALSSMPRKAKLSRKRASLAISNFMPHASSQGHSTHVEPPLQPSLAPQSSAPAYSTAIPLSIPTAQNLVSALDLPLHTMPRKAKLSRERASLGISNLMPYASPHGHSTIVEPPLQHATVAQSCAPTITVVSPSLPTAQNLVSPSDPPLHTMLRKAKHSKKRGSHAISNSMGQASSKGNFTQEELPLQPSLAPQSCAPASSTAIPPSIPTIQNLVSASDPSLHPMPRKAKLSRERASLGISNFMPHASSQGHSTHVQPPLQPSPAPQSCAPAYSTAMPCKAKLSRKRASLAISNFMPHASSQGHSTHVEPPLQPSLAPQSCAPAYSTTISLPIPTAQNLVSALDPPLHPMPCKAKHSRERASLGISNFMPNASSQVHSTYVEPPLQPSLAPKSCAPAYSTAIQPSMPTAQNLLSASDPPLHTMPRKAKHSKKRGSHALSNSMCQASSKGNFTHVELPLQPSLAPQSCAPASSTAIPPSIPTVQNLVSALYPSLHPMPRKAKLSRERASLGISNLMPYASSHGHSTLVEPPLQDSQAAQSYAPTITLVPPSIPTVDNLVSASDPPLHTMPCKSKRSKKRVSHGISNLMPHASSQGHSIPMESLLQPSEIAQLYAPPVVLIPSSIPVTQDPVSPSDPSSIPVTQEPVSQSDPSSHSTSDTFDPPYTLTQQPLAPYNRPYRGRQWNVQAIDEHGNTNEIQVTKPGVFQMPPGQRIVVPFDGQLRAYGEAATLLSGACGRIVADSKNIPINFDSWPKVPKSYKDDCFNILKTLFHFEASESIARRYCLLTMSRKYRNGKLKLWIDAFDPSLSREQLIAKVPYGIPEDQWLSFIDNHLKPEYQELCRKNAEVRQRQTVPHTSGAKLLSRKQHEMEEELGRPVSRVELYLATHKKKDGSYVNEEARSIGEKLKQEISKCANSTETSTIDALAKVLGRDHCGRVRCLGLGGLHSVAFQSTAKFSGIGNLSHSDLVESSQLKEEVSSLKNKLAASEENVKTLQNIMLAYIQMKEGHIPAELGALFDTTNQADESRGQDMSTSESGSSLASNRH